MPNAHIIPTDDRWNVKQENGDIVSSHDTQAEAEQAAKEWARAEGGGEVFTHRDEGGVLPHPQRRRCLTGPLADHRPDFAQRDFADFPARVGTGSEGDLVSAYALWFDHRCAGKRAYAEPVVDAGKRAAR